MTQEGTNKGSVLAGLSLLGLIVTAVASLLLGFWAAGYANNYLAGGVCFLVSTVSFGALARTAFR